MHVPSLKYLQKKKAEQIPLMYRRDSIGRGRGHQAVTVIGITLTLFATGNVYGFSSVAIPTLLSSTSDLKVDEEDISWMASLVTVGILFGTLFGALISDTLGRKKSLLLSSAFFSIGWIIIAQATTLSELLTGRVLTGIASGIYSATVQVYLCEVVEPEIRGVAGSLPTLMVTIGILSIWCLGSLLNWKDLAMICSIFPMIVFIYAIFLPESPVWLMSRGRRPEALQSLQWLRNLSRQAEQECLRIEYLWQRRSSRDPTAAMPVSSVSPLSLCFTKLLSPRVLKPLFIGMALFFVQQFSGSHIIIFYATVIFRYADNFINDYVETITLGIVRMLATLLGIFFVNIFTRRFLLILSGTTMGFSTGTLGVYFWFRTIVGDYGNSTLAHPAVQLGENHGAITFSIEWVPLVCLLIFMVAYSVGFGIIPWFLIAELLPSDARSLGTSVALTFNQLCLFTSVKTFLTIADHWTTYGTFWFYSAITFLGVAFVILVIPETANLDEVEIEDIFDHVEHFDDIDLSEEDEHEPHSSKI